MRLFFHELIHLSLSFGAAGITWLIFKNKHKNNKKLITLSLIGGLLGEFFIDIDHLVDYFFAFGTRFRLGDFLAGAMFDKLGKTFVPLHAWEWVLILAVLVLVIKNKNWKYFICAAAIGMFFHLAYDTISNHFYIQGYSLIYRIIYNFNLNFFTYPD